MASSDSENDDFHQLQRRFVNCFFRLTKHSSICKHKNARKISDDRFKRGEMLFHRAQDQRDGASPALFQVLQTNIAVFRSL